MTDSTKDELKNCIENYDTLITDSINNKYSSYDIRSNKYLSNIKYLNIEDKYNINSLFYMNNKIKHIRYYNLSKDQKKRFKDIRTNSCIRYNYDLEIASKCKLIIILFDILKHKPLTIYITGFDIKDLPSNLIIILKNIINNSRVKADNIMTQILNQDEDSILVNNKQYNNEQYNNEHTNQLTLIDQYELIQFNSKNLYVILLYIPFCVFCKKFITIWNKSIENYSNIYNFIIYNCVEEECNSYKYIGTPTIYIKTNTETLFTSTGYKDYDTFTSLLLKYK